MVDVYKELIEKEGCVAEIVLSNNALDILKYTNDVINCDIHTREETKELLKNNGANVISMSDILNKSYNGSGYNEKYGLLGTNRATEERVKLFPRTGQTLVENVQKRLKEETGKNIEVMVYGDGAFKDPVGHIWELADPVVSPAYTKGLEGSPNELKLKYLSENKFKNLSGEDLNNAIREEIKNKDNDLKGKMASQGTTPRRYTDLLGSLCDLTSGSGDKGTPVVLIQRYFNNYSD
jgi:F420-0:gamma-glutamyl ligase